MPVYYTLSRCNMIRSLREAVAGPQREANSQEKDDHQEMYAKPLLQRVVQFRGSIRTNTGTAETIAEVVLVECRAARYRWCSSSSSSSSSSIQSLCKAVSR